MPDPTFDSSDATRTGKPLRFARTVRFDRPLELSDGARLPRVEVTYETWGSLSARRDNAVLICHALSGDSHVTRHEADDDPGWWEIMVGPGKPIDTERFHVICANVLGGCRGTTGPNSINPDTGEPYGADFPVITVEDMVDVQKMLLDELGIERLLAVVGGSLGGHQALCWAVRYPDRMAGCVAVATSPRLTSQALAFDVVGRNAILRDPNYHGGQYYDKEEGPDVGLALARMLAHITYLSPEAMELKFDADRMRPRDVPTAFEKKFSVGSYLAYQGDRFVERFDANSYIVLSMAMDRFELGRDQQQIAARLDAAQCAWLVLSFNSDWLFPPWQSRQIVDALIDRARPVTYCNVTSPSGHDAFLLSDSIEVHGEMTRAFLGRLCHAPHDPGPTSAVSSTGSGSPAEAAEAAERAQQAFDGERLDIDILAGLIEPGTSVLDLGCGDGQLLAALRRRGHRRLMGVELDEPAIVQCARRGLDVIHADLNDGLRSFSDQQFDYVVLSQTLQSIVNTEAIVAEMVRVGRYCIVSYPNFGYFKVRRMVAEEGRSPRTAHGLLHYPWYRTPNRRFFSVLDWRDFCAEKSIEIHHELFLDTETGRQITEDPNLRADLAICIISG